MTNWKFVNKNETIDIPKEEKIIFIDEVIDSSIIFNVSSKVKVIFNHDKKSTNSKIEFRLISREADLSVREIAYTSNDEKFIKDVVINHDSKNSISDYKFFGFASDKSNLRISAKSKIKKGMSKSEAHQIIRVITSEEAKATGEPGLFIDDYDVKASHGNSIGQVNERELYYLQSKGINKKSARWMILEGKINDALQGIDQEFKESLISNLRSKIHG